MLGRDQTSIDLSLKTYGVKKGLATSIHSQALKQGGKIALVHPSMSLKDSADQTGNSEGLGDLVQMSDKDYFIKGPMGRGL